MAKLRPAATTSPDTRIRLQAQLDRRLRWHRRVHDAESEPRNRSALAPALRRWQATRLARTYADLRADPRTGPATEFFLEDLYGDRDFSDRDRGIARIAPLMGRLLPLDLLSALGQVVALGALSHALDLRVAVALERAGVDPRKIDVATYARAYRSVGLARLRRRQIEAIVDIGRVLDAAVHRPGLDRLLKLSRLPARAAGVGDLQSLLERGFAAFRTLDGASSFLATIAGREERSRGRLLSGEPDPFGENQPNSRSR
jgi:hypothetical protein